MPIRWDELEVLPGPGVFTLEKALEHLRERKSDPWKGYLALRQRIQILE